ncbi:MAG: HTH-type transcriptional regulator, sugar sensing transcriptional regulator [Patescibacteria group bacterium]|nr:HTH-type transcriptional regulator, sugar sensing transcriptional regulator [Patescibacteria group bacterium]
MNEIIASLGHIGLSDKEAKVYLASLKLGEASVSDIADEATIKRPTTYIILDELRKKGLIIKIPHAKKALFQAKTPDELYEQTVSNINRFEKVLPKLRSINPSKKNIKTLYFEGLDGMKEALLYKIEGLKGTTNDGFWAKDDGTIPKPMLDLFHKWNASREKNNITISGITPEHDSTLEFFEKYKESHQKIMRVPQTDYNSDISIEVTDKFVRIIDPHDLKAIIIENERVSESLKQIFALAKRNFVKKEPVEMLLG